MACYDGFTAKKVNNIFFYFDKIASIVGSGTSNFIVQYKVAKGLSFGMSLDFEEEYQLISSAKEMNNKNNKDTIGLLKGLGLNRKHAQRS